MKIKKSNKKRIKKIEKAEKKLQKALKKEARNLEKETNTIYDEAILSWSAPEYMKHKKGTIWYAAFVILFIGGAILAYIFDAWSFALVLAVFVVTYLVVDRKNPKKVKVILSNLGIKVGKRIYQYNRIQAFWINYAPPFVRTLNIRVHGEYMVDIEIQLDKQNPSHVHQFLSQKVPELEGKKEGLISIFSRIFKL
ncbi:hypothetical protein HOE67_03785 [Candidatus Peregrinibacteria bacterium]|jgi:hypothetical protein|nr:hypothetical protein [Candidatus Peregrinibacteria bacterium]MBT4056207.1 hypothetical protein [Candidatus Peregrinibacteria bacterium]